MGKNFEMDDIGLRYYFLRIETYKLPNNIYYTK